MQVHVEVDEICMWYSGCGLLYCKFLSSKMMIVCSSHTKVGVSMGFIYYYRQWALKMLLNMGSLTFLAFHKSRKNSIFIALVNVSVKPSTQYGHQWYRSTLQVKSQG